MYLRSFCVFFYTASIALSALAAPMVSIPAGSYRPLLPGKNEPKKSLVPAFKFYRHAVTNREFARFVRAHPKWAKGNVPGVFADKNYLSHWTGKRAFLPRDKNAPVVNVSYFAARAYCQAHAARLPTTAEWEYVGSASETAYDGREDPTYNQRILDWYGRPSAAGNLAAVEQQKANAFGVHDMHGLVWEWTSDFNSVLVTGESRGDSALERGLFCGSGSIGAADPSDYASFMRTAFRSSLIGKYTGASLGFRCAKDKSP